MPEEASSADVFSFTVVDDASLAKRLAGAVAISPLERLYGRSRERLAVATAAVVAVLVIFSFYSLKNWYDAVVPLSSGPICPAWYSRRIGILFLPDTR